MDAVSHGSVSVLLGLLYVIFAKTRVPIFLLLAVLFVFGVLIDYDHFFYYKKKFPEVKMWNIPQLIKVYFRTLDERDDFIYHTWLHEPFGVIIVSGISFLIFWFTPYRELTYLAIGCYVGHFLLDLLSGKMKLLAPFSDKHEIELKILPPNHFVGATISLGVFLIAVTLVLFVL